MAETQIAPAENGIALDDFNAALRASPGWQDFMKRQGYTLAAGQPIRLSDKQRKALKAELERTGVQFPKGIEIDPAGNVNQDQGVSRVLGNKWVKIGLISGAALATMGAAGYGPLAGVLGHGGAAAGAGAGAGGAAGGAVAAGTSTIPVVTAAGGLSKWLDPILRYGVPAATGLVGQHLAANADRDALDFQREALDKALAAEKEERDYRRAFDEEQRGYSRGQYADYLGRLSPYGDAGRDAVGRASALLTTSRYRPELVGAPAGRPVRLRAPDGSEQDVPETLADHYIQRGAQRV